MRFLFSFAGGAGHFLPLLPLARGLTADGHTVAFAGQSAMLSTVAQAGFEAFDAGGSTERDGFARTPLLKLDLEREYRVVRDGYANRVARQRAATLLALARSWKPDLMVCDEMDFGCPIAAERLSIPHATVLVIASGMLAETGLDRRAIEPVASRARITSRPGNGDVEPASRPLPVSGQPA